jgi:Tol biopolymer transport system component
VSLKRCLNPFIVLVVLLASSLARPQDELSLNEDRLLATIPADVSSVGKIEFSPDGRHVAYVASVGGKSVVVVDNIRSEEFDSINGFGGRALFCPDGKRVVYLATRGESIYMVVGSKRSEAFAEVGFARFSPDGAHVAFWATNGKNGFVVVDGIKGRSFDWVVGQDDFRLLYPDPIFHPDDGRVAYRAGQDGKSYVVFGDELSEGFDFVASPVFSRDGSSLGFVARRGPNYFVVSGTKKGPEFDYVEGLTAGPGRSGFAYRANTGGRLQGPFVVGGRWRIVVGDQVSPEYERVGDVAMSPDGKRSAYSALDADDWAVIVDGQRGEGFSHCDWLIFSRDGKHLAYRARRGGKTISVVDGRRGEEFEGLDNLVFSPDGRTIAYRAMLSAAPGDPPRWFVVVGSKRGRLFDDVGIPVLSPDGSTVAYRARLAEGYAVVVDNRVSKTCSFVTDPVVSSDGRRVEFGVRQGDELRWKISPIPR